MRRNENVDMHTNFYINTAIFYMTKLFKHFYFILENTIFRQQITKNILQ